jgi:hypothetical protein
VSSHVDIVRNDWLAGRQSVVARASLADGKLTIDSPQPGTWSEVVLRPLRDPDTGKPISADGDPDRFFAALSSQLHGSHLFATEPHEEQECPFPTWEQTLIEPGIPIPKRQPKPATAAVTARSHRRAG